MPAGNKLGKPCWLIARMFSQFILGAWAIVFLAACFTEVGNPGKTQKVNASFSIDYVNLPPDLQKSGSGRKADTASVRILQFYFNVVEANYTTLDSVFGRIWRLPDSMGRSIDFTGKDPLAALPPVTVPAGAWSIMKLESRIPLHDSLRLDTLDFAGFKNRGYIQGEWISGLNKVRFICQFPDVYRINLVYPQAILEQWRHNDIYELEFVFYATKWVKVVSLANAVMSRDRQGVEVAIIDLEHNPEMFLALKASFFKSFNSKVWKEVP
jgi:hypothetical protein